MNKRTLICTATIAGAVLVGAPQAYVVEGPTWASHEIPYYINPANNDVTATAAESAIQVGASAWSQQTNANFQFFYAGRTSGTTLQNNGKNEIFFRNTSNGGVIAETYWTYDANNHLVDADMVFYDGGFTFFTGSTGCSGGVYIEDTATHEFGHALGLAHSPVSTATMYATANWCSTSGRSLDPDDIAGVEALYPPSASNTPPTVAITSPAANSTLQGSTVTFTGTAADQQDGNLSSRVSWRSSINGALGTGSSVTAALSAGTHTISAVVTDSAGVSATAQESVVVVTAVQPPPPSTGITLSASGSKVKGVQQVKLAWSGATSTSVDVFRNGALISTTANDGSMTDALNKKGSATYTYQVCAAGTTTCSANVKVVF